MFCSDWVLTHRPCTLNSSALSTKLLWHIFSLVYIYIYIIEFHILICFHSCVYNIINNYIFRDLRFWLSPEFRHRDIEDVYHTTRSKISGNS